MRLETKILFAGVPIGILIFGRLDALDAWLGGGLALSSIVIANRAVSFLEKKIAVPKKVYLDWMLEVVVDSSALRQVRILAMVCVVSMSIGCLVAGVASGHAFVYIAMQGMKRA